MEDTTNIAVPLVVKTQAKEKMRPLNNAFLSLLNNSITIIGIVNCVRWAGSKKIDDGRKFELNDSVK